MQIQPHDKVNLVHISICYFITKLEYISRETFYKTYILDGKINFMTFIPNTCKLLNQ